jgi:hypothetical protein
MAWPDRPRRRLAFRAVNRRDDPAYDPGLQRHHLLPRQLLRLRCFRPLLNALGRDRLCFDDFRSNGLLLPADDGASVRTRLPLHRGPHRAYNEMVAERVGEVEASWARARTTLPEAALVDAAERLASLQGALRRRLLEPERRLTLNRRDPLGAEVDFSDIDAMAAQLWGAGRA